MRASKPEEFDESALICRLPDLDEYVQPLREKYTVDGAQGAPPHITLLYPFLSWDAWSEKTPLKLRAVTSAISQMRVTFEKLSWLEDTRILVMLPESVDEILDVIRKLAEAFPACPPCGGDIQMNDLIPHVTIAVARHDQDCTSIEREAQAAIGDCLPIHIYLDAASLLVKRGSAWSYVLDFPFGG